MAKTFQAIVVTRIVLEVDDEATAYDVVNQAARCPGPVGLHFTIKQYHPEVKMLAEMPAKKGE